MTAAFATLRNSADTKATVVSATSTVSPTVELHETATGTDGQMTMRPKEGGFTIPAKGSHTLEPGADHIMMMKIAKPIKPGDTVSVTLTFADKSTKTFIVSARTFTGAKEDYTGDSDTGMPEDMGDSGHGNG
ncbi:MAG: copper chaperone PCu(A)C [Actinomycetota bacterium]|nr:copper chaperone PCu(A)C [Actinomycetota bacterium]